MSVISWRNYKLVFMCSSFLSLLWKIRFLQYITIWFVSLPVPKAVASSIEIPNYFHAEFYNSQLGKMAKYSENNTPNTVLCFSCSQSLCFLPIEMTTLQEEEQNLGRKILSCRFQAVMALGFIFNHGVKQLHVSCLFVAKVGWMCQRHCDLRGSWEVKMPPARPSRLILIHGVICLSHQLSPDRFWVLQFVNFPQVLFPHHPWMVIQSSTDLSCCSLCYWSPTCGFLITPLPLPPEAFKSLSCDG